MNGMTRLGLTTVLASALLACGADAPTGIPADGPDASVTDTELEPVASVLQGPRPLRGTLSGSSTLGSVCSTNPPGLLVTASGEGTVGHLGAAGLVQHICVDQTFTPVAPSDITLVSANGDEVSGWVIGLAFRVDGFDMDVTVAGGTGRFTDATGAYTVHVTQAAPLTPWSATVEGWISY